MNKSNTIQNNNCEGFQSEMQNKYQNPIIKKPPVTRSKRLEQFLWHEFYQEYIRSKESLNVLPSRKSITEYTEEYCKPSTPRYIEENLNYMEIYEGITKKFPLYADSAITFWNPKGDSNIRNFGKNLSITLPISQQHGQFG